MCEFDFDYYVEPLGLIPWERRFGRCDCGYLPTPGEPMQCWIQNDDDLDSPTRKPCQVCELEGELYVVDDYGVETEVARECPYCRGDGYLPSSIEELAHGTFCPRCFAASKLLDAWCDGMYSYGRIPEQVAEHWTEDTLYQSWPFARLVVMARRQWKARDGYVPVDDIDRIVARLVERVPA